MFQSINYNFKYDDRRKLSTNKNFATTYIVTSSAFNDEFNIEFLITLNYFTHFTYGS